MKQIVELDRENVISFSTPFLGSWGWSSFLTIKHSSKSISRSFTNHHSVIGWDTEKKSTLNFYLHEFLKDVVKEIGNDYAGILADGSVGDIGGYVDTGSYISNALVSGSIKVVFLLIRSLLSQNHLQVRHSFVLVL